jgi:V8-like Glu-specific endopeptidase
MIYVLRRFSIAPLFTLLLLPTAANLACEDSTSVTFVRSDIPPSEIVLGRKRFVQRGPARSRDRSTGTLTPSAKGAEPTMAIDPHAAEKISQLSVEEYADKLRLVTLFANYEYVEATPNLELATSLRTQKAGPVINPPGMPHIAPVADTGNAGPVGRDILGSDDNRTIVWNNTAAPYNSYLAVNLVDGWCSAVTIGLHTAISAGHCFLENGNWHIFDPNNPGDPSYLAPGANAGGNNFPWGKFTCFDIWMYNGWSSNPVAGNSFWDMSVLDFSVCPDQNNPGWAAGYNGMQANLVFTPTTLTVFGYPGTCPGMVQWPQLCGMGGTGSIDLPGGLVEEASQSAYLDSEVIDTTGGQSGASWTWQHGSNFYTVGTHIGPGNLWPRQSNFARRLANEYWSLVQTVSVDF